MAPAVAGIHRAVDCPRCGYHFLVGRHPSDQGDGRCSPRVYQYAACPNCGCQHLKLRQMPESPGEQLLVHKHVFALRRPRRWEMIVFRLLGKTFIKRLIGLPGEWLEICDGDVYVNNQLVRKTLAEVKAVRIPVFDNNYQPRPEGWRERWEVIDGGDLHPLRGTELHLDAENDKCLFQLVSYRHYLLDEHKCGPICDEYAYNAGDPAPAEMVHDFMLECDVEVARGEGIVLVALNDGHDQVVAELAIGRAGAAGVRLGLVQAETTCRREAIRTIAAAPGVALKAGRSYHLELAFVDRRATLAIDGALPFAAVDLPPVRGRPGVVRPVLLGARGVSAVVRNFRLFRDVHYTQVGTNAVRGKGVRLGAGQYFVLGDNSPHSEDSRFWPDQGAVPEDHLLGKPFLVYLPRLLVIP